MTDEITNWYEMLDSEIKNETGLDKNFDKHFIHPCSMILAIAPTGGGKSIALLDFLARKDEAFHKIIIFSGSSTDEPLYNLIRDRIPETEFYEDIEELPSLNEEEDNEHEKLIVFDDFINLKPKEFKKIKEYLTAGRKKKYTVYLNAQNYVEVPKTITRNCNYFLVFKQNDNATINNILKNHNVDNIDKEVFKSMYADAVEKPRSFFMVDIHPKGGSLRRNFLNFYHRKPTLKGKGISSKKGEPIWNAIKHIGHTVGEKSPAKNIGVNPFDFGFKIGEKLGKELYKATHHGRY